MKYLIIGGVAGGATAAARIRRIDEKAQIVLIEKGKYISYANCGLPYYIGGTIKERNRLFVQTPESFGTRFNIDVRVENEVVSIDTVSKSVVVRRADGSLYDEKYDKLLLSPGASPVRPPIKGIDSDGIFTLRNVDDTDKIKHFITHNKVKNAVVVGAGFIGLEMAENLHRLGAEVSIVEKSNQVMAPLDYSMAAHIHQHLLQKGVRLLLEHSVESFERKGNKIEIRLNNGKAIETEMVILSIGVSPDTALAKTADIAIGQTGGIAVNEYLETSAKDVYAVGDAIEYPHPITGKPWLNYLANPANRQGRIVADNMVLGNKVKYEGAIGTAIAKVFDMTVATTGLAAKHLKQMNIPYAISNTHSGSHAGYYPGAMPLSIKLIFDPASGKILGAQSVGYNGVDKRIDQIALLIKNGGTVYDLTRVEHAYAPPFSSAKDPIAIAGYTASNVVDGVMPVITWRQVKDADASRVMLLDVRTEQEFASGSIEGAVNIPLDSLRNNLHRIPTDKPVYVFCAIGLRGYLAINILRGNGYTNISNLSGGYKTYSTAVADITEPSSRSVNKSEPNIDTQNQTSTKTLRVDACGLQCPGPILKIKQAIDTIAEGETVEITATDAGFSGDVKAWCNSTGNTLISNKEDSGRYTVIVQKTAPKASSMQTSTNNKNKTFILFSDDLDKALAIFVLANGAAATGQKVSIFFTFWGLNAIKKLDKPNVEKDIFGRMFSMMMPGSSLKLKLSKMNMGGMGRRMMRYIMGKKGIASLESMRNQALELGVEFIACQMSMEVMGVKREELLDEVTVGGVATYIERADKSNINLFI